MEDRRTVWKIAHLLVAAGLLGPIPAWSVAAEGANAPQARSETAQTADDTGASGADADFDGSAGSVLPSAADIPLAALFLVGVCVLGAGLGPHARRSRQDTEQDTVLPESHVGREGRAPN